MAPPIHHLDGRDPYEQTYHRWVERAWRGGLRQMTVLLVDNNVLCTVYPFTRNSCNEMDAVRLQAERLREFEDYIDAQSGGPGRGWFRIVEDPFEARRVMNEGKLAVTLGIEVSVLFDCSIDLLGNPTCHEGDIDRQLDEVYELGVRQMELVNKSDNALGGVAGDAGETGVLTNVANLYETGSFLRMGSCEDLPEGATDRPQINLADDFPGADGAVDRDGAFALLLDQVGTSGLAPVYGPGPHCNELGLTDLGAHTIRGMVARGMIFDPDHLSARARQDAMALIEELEVSNIMSTHSWADDDIYERVLRAGGFVTPIAMRSDRFVAEWLKHRRWADERYLFAFGVGSDVNGFATQPAPRPQEDGVEPVSYPFEGFGGVTVDRQVSGERTFDVNEDGVAHFGLYPDWVEDLRMQAGDAIVADLERGAEAYLQVWERSVGVAGDSCRDDVAGLTRAQLAAVERGSPAEEVLLVLGQPRDRQDGDFTYCLEDGGTVRVAFDGDGRVRAVRRGPRHAPAQPGPAELDTAVLAAADGVREALSARMEIGAPAEEERDHEHPEELVGAQGDAAQDGAAQDGAAQDGAAEGSAEGGELSPTSDGGAGGSAGETPLHDHAVGAEDAVTAGPLLPAGLHEHSHRREGPLVAALTLLGLAAVVVRRAHLATIR